MEGAKQVAEGARQVVEGGQAAGGGGAMPSHMRPLNRGPRILRNRSAAGAAADRARRACSVEPHQQRHRHCWDHTRKFDFFLKYKKIISETLKYFDRFDWIDFDLSLLAKTIYNDEYDQNLKKTRL